MKKTGRPLTEITDEQIKQAYRLALLGIKQPDMADVLDIPLTTFEKLIRRNTELRRAIKKGGKIADSRVVAALYERAKGYSHPDIHISNHKGEITITPYMKHYAPDPVSCFFWLKNRQRDLWKDKQDVNVTGELKLQQLSDEELELKKQAMLRQLDIPLKAVG